MLVVLRDAEVRQKRLMPTLHVVGYSCLMTNNSITTPSTTMPVNHAVVLPSADELSRVAMSLSRADMALSRAEMELSKAEESSVNLRQLDQMGKDHNRFASCSNNLWIMDHNRSTEGRVRL